MQPVEAIPSSAWYVGIDDTDVIDYPGTNQLARHIVQLVADRFEGRLILRHQLLEDPRVPCTRKNGCVSLRFILGPGESQQSLIECLRPMILAWAPPGSDPGLCVTQHVPAEVVSWGLRCQRELVRQADARQLAAEHGLHLEGLGGTQDGVIGALAAVGLGATANDGRVVHFGRPHEQRCELTGAHSAEALLAQGVEEIRCLESQTPVTAGTIDLGKRLRPNYRQARVVQFVSPTGPNRWEAVRVK